MDTNVALRYAVEDLIDERNRELYEELTSRITISLGPGADSYWSSQLNGDTGIILSAPTAHPISCFTHEMLHLKLRLDGLTMPYVFSASPVDKFTLSFFYNELAHHRMFPRFYAMGFDAREFYNDADADASLTLLQQEMTRLKESRRRSRANLAGLDVARPYFLLYSPGWKRGGMQRVAEQLDELADRAFLRTLDAILLEWIESDSLDLRRPFARIFKACGITDIGFSLSKDGEEMLLSREV